MPDPEGRVSKLDMQATDIKYRFPITSIWEAEEQGRQPSGWWQ